RRRGRSGRDRRRIAPPAARRARLARGARAGGRSPRSAVVRRRSSSGGGGTGVEERRASPRRNLLRSPGRPVTVDVSLETHRALYHDWRAALAFCRTLPDVPPPRPTLFHMYWRERAPRRWFRARRRPFGRKQAL